MAVFPPLLAPDGESLVLDSSRLLLGFALTASAAEPPRHRASHDDILTALDRLGLTFEDDPWAAGESDGRRRLNHTQWALWVRDAQSGAIDDGRLAGIRQALAGLCDWIGPVYETKTPDGGVVRGAVLPHVLLTALRDGLKDDERDRALASLAELGLRERPELSRHLTSRHFVLDGPLRRSVFDLLPRLVMACGGSDRRDDDGTFVPADIDLSSHVAAGRTNYIYVRLS